MKNFGLLIITLSSVLYGVLNPLLKKSEKVPPFTAIAISMFFLFLLSLLISLVTEKTFSVKFIDDHRNEVIFLILVGLINTFSFALFLISMKYLPIKEVTLFNSLLTPFFAAIFSYFMLKEPINLNFFIGFVIVSIGLYITIK